MIGDSIARQGRNQTWVQSIKGQVSRCGSSWIGKNAGICLLSILDFHAWTIQVCCTNPFCRGPDMCNALFYNIWRIPPLLDVGM